MTELTPRELAFAGDAADTYVPRSGSPSRSLSELAYAASECAETESMVTQLSLTRGTVNDNGLGHAHEGGAAIGVRRNGRPGERGRLSVSL